MTTHSSILAWRIPWTEEPKYLSSFPKAWFSESPICPWDFPGKNTGVGCHFLLQGIFLNQESNPGLLHCRQILYWLSYERNLGVVLNSTLFLNQTLSSMPSNLWFPHFILLEKAMATHSSTLAWRIPWMEEPGRLQSMGLLRVGHDWTTSLSLFTFMHWRRKWQPTPVFLPGESQGQRSLLGCRLWGRTELDMTDATYFYFIPTCQEPRHSTYCNSILTSILAFRFSLSL